MNFMGALLSFFVPLTEDCIYKHAYADVIVTKNLTGIPCKPDNLHTIVDYGDNRCLTQA